MRALNSLRTVSQLYRGNLMVSAVRGASSGPAGQLAAAPRAATARRASALAMLLRGRCRVDGVATGSPTLPPLQRLCGSALGSTVYSSTSHLSGVYWRPPLTEISACLFASVLHAASPLVCAGGSRGFVGAGGLIFAVDRGERVLTSSVELQAKRASPVHSYDAQDTTCQAQCRP